MRNKTLALASVIISLGCLTGLAQIEDTPPPRPSEGSHHMGDGKMGRFLDRLPPDVRKRLEDAKQKAMQDPKIKALKKQSDEANHALFDALRTKMQEIDPGLHDLLKPYMRPEGGKGEGGGMDKLTQAERDQVKAAREKAMNDPAVQAAEAKKKAATTPQERRQAWEEYRKAMSDAMLKADPALEPVLKKLEANGPPPPPPDDATAPR